MYISATCWLISRKTFIPCSTHYSGIIRSFRLSFFSFCLWIYWFGANNPLVGGMQRIQLVQQRNRTRCHWFLLKIHETLIFSKGEFVFHSVIHWLVSTVPRNQNVCARRGTTLTIWWLVKIIISVPICYKRFEFTNEVSSDDNLLSYMVHENCVAWRINLPIINVDIAFTRVYWPSVDRFLPLNISFRMMSFIGIPHIQNNLWYQYCFRWMPHSKMPLWI